MNYCRQSWLASLLLLLVSSSQQQLGCHGFTSSTSSSSHSPNNKCTSYSSESTRNSLSLSNGRSITLLFLHPDQAAELEEAAKKLLEKHRYCYNATLDEDINIDMSSSSTSTSSCSSNASDGSDGSSAVYDDTKFAQKSPLSVASASKRSAHAPLGPTAKWWSRTFSSFVRRHE